MNNPEGRTFANEKFEPSADGVKHNATRVFSTEGLEKQIARDELKRANNPETRKDEYEVQASDVKAPTKLVIGLVAGVIVAAGLIFAIAFPMYRTRTALRSDIESSITEVFDGLADVDTTLDAQGKFYNGFSIFGQKCQYINVVTAENIGENEAVAIFENYCKLRASRMNKDGSVYDGVRMKLYCADGYYTVTGSENGVVSEFTQDEAEV